MKSNKFTRRIFLTSATLIAGVAAFPAPSFLRAQNLNSKLNVGCIGIGGRGQYNVNGVRGENIITVCDVDKRQLDKFNIKLQDTAKFSDYRKMFDKFGDKLDAVTVSTPDHTHAAISITAMKLGINCYTEKPLAHNVNETQQMIKIAKEKNLKTQMGIQIHSQQNYPRVVELIQAGAIGKINEVHIWVDKAWGGRPIPKGEFDVPEYLDWDAWLGPAAFRAYNPCYVPGGWRSYWAFGTGTLGDMACHFFDLPYWALGLRRPAKIEASGPPVDPECCPLGLTVKFEYPKTDKHEALTLTWYDNKVRPKLIKEKGLPNWKNGVIFVGSEGLLLSDYDKHILYPEEKFKDYKRPDKSIPPSQGHYAEWLQAIKNNKTTSCNFDYSGIMTEAILLGVIAYRTNKKLTWDETTLKTNNAEANAMLISTQRKGWEF
ncbi:MAG: Gfo/Idh/MocA family oxidoreductase [Planctomycetaceae bacterium]|jgi:predicted dehydrogenase|nr:Gfo/Idh/MocA family oxidoreductase [Planctomycetaceae bacterium]